jgi:conjugative relaxase-like TrwC/TraI family protein
MLSTAKIGTGSWRYYANQVQHGACEYFLGLGEAPGRWYGRGLDALGLAPSAVVTERELEALFGRAIHPGTGEQLGRTWRVDGVTGYDLCLSAPKSVSALWAIGKGKVPASVQAAHRAAVRTALDYLDTHAAFSRVGTDGHTQVATAGFAAAVFDHRTSRAGDPQLHSHALVVNKLGCPDGGWRTIDGREIYAHKKSAGTVYQAALRNELTRRLGVAWTPVSKDGQAEIAGIRRT